MVRKHGRDQVHRLICEVAEKAWLDQAD